MSEKKTKKTKEQLSDETQKVFDVLNEGTDLARVVLGAAFLDAGMEVVLRERFLKGSKTTDSLLKPTGPLGSYIARARLLYCLGLVSKETHQDLETIGTIRNMVAHNHLHVTFEDGDIQELCKKLKWWELPSSISENIAGSNDLQNVAKQQFVISLVLVFQQIHVTAFSVGSNPDYRIARNPNT